MTTLLFVGHSHTRCFAEPLSQSSGIDGEIIELGLPIDPAHAPSAHLLRLRILEALHKATGDARFAPSESVTAIRAAAVEHDVHIPLAMGGNEYFRTVLFTALAPGRGWALSGANLAAGDLVVPRGAARDTIRDLIEPNFAVVGALSDWFHRPIVQLESPPPLDDCPDRPRLLEELMGVFFAMPEFAARYREHLPELGHQGSFSDDDIRELLPLANATTDQLLALWTVQAEVIQSICAGLGVGYLPVPEQSTTASGFLRAELAGDLVHGNADYAGLVLKQIDEHLGTEATGPVTPIPPIPPIRLADPPTSSPYADAPDRAYWRKAVRETSADQVDPTSMPLPSISKQTRIATVGSCFAQNISRYLRAEGFNFLDAEPRPPIISTEVAEAYGYGQFSARYGNVYTSRQLLQLFERSLKQGDNLERDNEIWRTHDSTWVDPFRPRIHPAGYASPQELRHDRSLHLRRVASLLGRLDVLVITLGLTEAWVNTQTGAAYPLAPGVAAGRFDDAQHRLVNLTVDEVTADVTQAVALLRTVNPDASVVLTVSPVPLIATATDQHVLTATTYSKSVLRVAAQQLAERVDDLAYFPSYEVITGSFNRGRYFADDLRGATEEGVHHAMRLFFHHAAGLDLPAMPTPTNRSPNQASLDRLVHRVVCDLEALDD